MSFKDKCVLITGASRGIGKSIAQSMVSKGAKIIGTATNELGVSIINDYLGMSGKGIKLDFSNKDSINNFLKLIISDFNKIDILINNAGVTCDKLLVKMNSSEWESIIDINLKSAFITSKIVIRNMIKQRYGRIINISSVVGSIGNLGQTNYSAAKAGLIGFSKSLAKEVASYGITVNVISPGFILTDMTATLSDNYKKNILSRIPINRLGYPEDITNAVLFLASNKSSYITGETLHVNGGMYMA